MWASLVAQPVKNLPAMQETWAGSLGWEDPLEKGRAPHSSILAWRTPWTIESTGLQRVEHNLATEQQLLDNSVLLLQNSGVNLPRGGARLYRLALVFYHDDLS